MQIESTVNETISEILAVNLSKINPSSRFIEDLNADSLDKVELLLCLEDKFGIKIEDGDADKIKTVEDAIIFIKSNIEMK